MDITNQVEPDPLDSEQQRQIRKQMRVGCDSRQDAGGVDAGQMWPAVQCQRANQTARNTAAVLWPMAVRLTDMPMELFSRIGSRATGRRQRGSG